MDPLLFSFIALSGEQQHGPCSGAVVVDFEKTSATYVLKEHLTPEAVREQVCLELKRNPENMYILTKKDGHMHVFGISRARAYHEYTTQQQLQSKTAGQIKNHEELD